MKTKLGLVGVGLLLTGFGCGQSVPIQPVSDMTATAQVQEQKPAEEIGLAAAAKLKVARSFTVDEIETEGGGLKNWFRDLARANAAGTKTLVRVPVNHIQGFGCVVPTKYCVSTITGGCYGPFVDLKTNSSIIVAAPGTLWEVEGYVVAATRLPATKDDGTPGTCADGELAYDFEVTRVIQKLDTGYSDEYKFIQYSVE